MNGKQRLDSTHSRLSSWVARAMVAGFLVLATPGAIGQTLTDLFMSPEDEKRVGAEQHDAIVAQYGGEYPDPELKAYVNSIGQFLASTSQAPGVGYTFTVLNSPIINAFALPGGYVYVTRGLVALAENEAELAGVIAHEIGHVAARHSAKRHSKNVLTGLGLTVLGIATQSGALTQLAGVGANAILSSYSREDEFEADQLGVSYLSRAGFDPRAMSTFLEKMERHTKLEARVLGQQYRSGADFFASHPRTADRVGRAVELAQATRVNKPIVAQDIFYKKIDGMLYGDDPSQGLIIGRRFVHPDLRFEFKVPKGFTLFNQPTQVLARHKKGAVIKLDADRPYRGAMTDYIRKIWPRDAPAIQPEPLDINGFDAATAGARVQIQNELLDVRLVAINDPGERVFRLMFFSQPQLTATFAKKFRRTAFSFKRMSKSAASKIKPYVLRIRNAKSGDTIASLARQMAVSRYPRERLRLMNGLDKNQALRPGQPLKLNSAAEGRRDALFSRKHGGGRSLSNR